MTARPNYQLHYIPSGVAGVSATLAIMSKLVKQFKTSETIRKLALSIVAHLPGKKWAAEAGAVQSFVKNNIRYVRDVHGVETVQTPLETLRLGQGDCDDHATLVATLLASIGHPTRLIAIAKAPGLFSHVLTQTRIGDKWVAIETTQDWPLGRFPSGVVETKVRHN